MPFINRPAWISLQADCQDLRRCHAHLKQGTRPSKKLTNIKDTKRYSQNCLISRDGLLVVPHQEAFAPVKERIVVPRKVLPGLLTALHIKLVHPTQFQLKQIFSRYFFAGISGFQKLVRDTLLAHHRIVIELSRAKNINKNPVAEKSIQELEDEILKLDKDRSTVTNSQLAIAVANLNSRLRSQRLSSREMWTQRDQFTSAPLPLDDQKLLEDQHHRRLTYNMRHNQVCRKPSPDDLPIPEGSIVYINTERNKTQSRPRYIVSSQDGPWYLVKKFSGTQLRNQSYRVHRNQLSYIPIPDPPSSSQPSTTHNDEEEAINETESPPDPAVIAPLQPCPIAEPPSVLIPPAALTEPPTSVNITPNVQSRTSDVEISRPKRQTRLPVRFSDYDMS